MIPSENALLTEELELENGTPSKDYKLQLDGNQIAGFVDDLEAMRQVVYKILNTERYDYQIYSWNYGVELADLFGRPLTFVIPEVKRRITEALLQDDRIVSVDAFSYARNRNQLHIRFTVHTVFGEIEEALEEEFY